MCLTDVFRKDVYPKLHLSLNSDGTTENHLLGRLPLMFSATIKVLAEVKICKKNVLTMVAYDTTYQ